MVAECAGTALTMAAAYVPDLVFLNPQLTNGATVDVVSTIRTRSPRTAFVLIAHAGASPAGSTAVESHRALARLEIDGLVALATQVAHALEKSSSAATGSEPLAHAAARWASIVVRVIDSPTDPKTVARWSLWIAASPGTVRNWCHTAGVSPKRSLNFARTLRAVLRQRPGDQPQNLLDAVDLRTLAGLLKLGRTHAPATPTLPSTPEEFLADQRWITDPELLREARIALENRARALDRATRLAAR